MNNSKISKFFFHFTVVFFSLWFCYSFFLLVNSSQELLLLYLLYLILGIITIFAVREDILSPLGLFTLIAYQTFAMNIPLIASDALPILGHIPEATLVKVLSILLIAQASFILGYVLPIYKAFPGDIITCSRHSPNTDSVSIFTFLAIAAIVGFSCLFRIKFHLGEAGAQPSIAYAGYFLYLLLNGVLIICIWYFIQGIRQSRLHTILSLSLLIIMASAQAYLGWRAGIIHILLLVLFAFWYNQLFFKNKSVKIVGWVLLIVLLIPNFMQQANQFRTQRLGGETEIAATPQDFFNKLVARSQGTTRLAAVADMIGPLSASNKFFIFELYSKGMSATKYVDMKVYNIGLKQSHSVGTSGPGSPYVAMGLSGVAMAYFLLGILYRSAYHTLKANAGRNPFTIVWYALLAYALFAILSENFNLNTLKLLTAEAVMIFLIARLFSLVKNQTRKEINRNSQDNAIKINFV